MSKVGRITDSQEKIMKLVAQGCYLKEVATSLDISLFTVKNQVYHWRYGILSRLEAKTLPQAMYIWTLQQIPENHSPDLERRRESVCFVV